MDKQKFSSPIYFKELSQTPNRFDFPYVSSPYQCMILQKSQSSDNFQANQPQLGSCISVPVRFRNKCNLTKCFHI